MQQLHGVNATQTVGQTVCPTVARSVHTVQLLHRQFVQQFVQQLYSVNGLWLATVDQFFGGDPHLDAYIGIVWRNFYRCEIDAIKRNLPITQEIAGEFL